MVCYRRWHPIYLCLSSYVILQLPQCCRARSMCSILDQRTAIVGDRLFFSSGNYTFDDDGLEIHNTSSLYWLPLNTTVDVSGPIDMSVLGSSELPSEALTGGKDPVSGGFGGAFFYDHTSFYAYAGMVGPEADGVDNALWSYNTTDDAWKLVQVQGGKISFGNNSEGAHASDPQTGASFYTGGWEMAYNGTHNGTVKFQSFNSDTPQWSFLTATSGMQGPDILKGAMVYLRKGQSGVLLAFGGYQTAYRGTEFGSGWDWDRRKFSDIFVYDIFSNTWYLQEATGDIPDPRAEFCAGVSAAPDDSSFQVTIHAGWDQLAGSGFNDVYVLSIPAFRWIKVDDSNNPDLLVSDEAARNRLKCDVWNDTQLIVSGGLISQATGDLSDLEFYNKVCNKTYPPFKVLDTSSYTWRTQFDPSLEYSVPDVVTAVIGGNSSGGAVVKSPSTGWSSNDLSDIFSQTVARDTYKASNDASSSGNSDSPKSSPTDTRNSTGLSGGAIAGIAIGAIAFIAAVVAGVLAWFKKSKQRTAYSGIADPDMVEPRWRKPELDADNTARYELSEQHWVHEAAGTEVVGNAKQYPAELPNTYLVELGTQPTSPQSHLKAPNEGYNP